MNLRTKNNNCKLVLISFLIIACAVIPIMAVNNGNFYLVGDYMTQQIPFVKECRRMLLSGTPFWSSNTFLGANFLGTYSFYNYCSPFFWPLFLLPENLIGAGMGIMFIIKHVVAALTSHLYLKNHIQTPHLCFIGSLLYAFSSFSMDASFFYHFIDVIAVFPLILYCVDEVLEKRKTILLALCVMLNACINYYFFVGTSVFFLIYITFRIKFSNGRYTIKDALRCIVFYTIGGLASMFILLPSALSLLETNKATGSFFNSFLRGFAAIPQIIKLLKGIVLPSEGIMDSAIGFQYSVFNSNNAFLPFFGAVFVFTSLRLKQKNWHSKLFRFIFILTLVPFGNGAFSFFTNMSYTRWWYAFVLMEVLTSLHILEEMKHSPKTAISEYKKSAKKIAIISAIVVGGPLLLKLLSAYLLKDLINAYLPQGALDYLASTGLTDEFSIDNLRYAAVFVIMIAINYIPLYLSVKKSSIYNAKKAIPAAALICLLTYSIYLINETNILSSSYEDNYRGGDQSVSEDVSYNSRIQYSYTLANYPMVSNKPGVSVFHSFKSYSTAQFGRLAGFENKLHATSNRHFTTPAIQTVLSIETIVDENGNESKAPYYSPFGYAYEYYIIDEGYDYTTNIDENNRRIEIMTKACFVDKKTADKISNIANALDTNANIDITQSCEANTASAVTDFNLNSSGFTAHSSSDKTRLIYFSIPGDNGWKAYINDEPAEILTLNGGMMGLIVPEGENYIQFKFITPGLLPGIVISAFTLICLGIYSLIIHRKKKI